MSPGCCTFPNGPMVGFTLLGALISFITTVIAVNSCRFFSIHGELTSSPPTYHTNEFDFGSGIGLTGYQSVSTDNIGSTSASAPYNYIDGCLAWSSDMEMNFLDAPILIARQFGQCAVWATLISLVILSFTSCYRFGRTILRLIGALLLLASLFSLLTYTAFASFLCRDEDIQATFSAGAGWVLVASASSFVTGLFLFQIPEAAVHMTPAAGTATTTSNEALAQQLSHYPLSPTNPGFNEQQQQEPGSTIVVVEYLSDGGMRTTHTTLNADGSKTVTETIERPV